MKNIMSLLFISTFVFISSISVNTLEARPVSKMFRGLLGGLPSDQRNIKGKIINEQYYSADGMFVVDVPHKKCHGDGKDAGMQTLENYEKMTTTLVFGPAPNDSTNYIVEVSENKCTSGPEEKIEDCVARMVAMMYLKNPIIVKNHILYPKTIINGQPAYRFEMEVEVPAKFSQVKKNNTPLGYNTKIVYHIFMTNERIAAVSYQIPGWNSCDVSVCEAKGEAFINSFRWQ